MNGAPTSSSSAEATTPARPESPRYPPGHPPAGPCPGAPGRAGWHRYVPLLAQGPLGDVMTGALAFMAQHLQALDRVQALEVELAAVKAELAAIRGGGGGPVVRQLFPTTVVEETPPPKKKRSRGEAEGEDSDETVVDV